MKLDSSLGDSEVGTASPLSADLAAVVSANAVAWKAPSPSTWQRLREVALLLLFGWVPMCWWLAPGHDPVPLLLNGESLAAVCMFLVGATIANATAVGGGMVFNPTLQVVFGVSGYSALSLSVLAQCAGMTSGARGWYQSGVLSRVAGRSLLALVLFTLAATAAASCVFAWLVTAEAGLTLVVAKAASAAVSFYVARVVWTGRSRGLSSDPAGAAPAAPYTLRVDRQMYPWLLLGSSLNVFTAVGTGELAVSHLMKYYRPPMQVAVAVGTVLQATSVLVQGVFVVALFWSYVPVNLLLVGVLGCLLGGRLGPLVLAHPRVAPHVHVVLSAAALAMGVASTAMLLTHFSLGNQFSVSEDRILQTIIPEDSEPVFLPRAE